MSNPDLKQQISVWRPVEGALPRGAWFGVPTRRGGASRGPYASLNLGLHVGDTPEDVTRNQDLLRQTLGIREPFPLRVRQVHGTRVVTPDEAPSDADGFLLMAGDPWTAISVADCAPVALFARDGSQGALVHAGWRGARDGIAPHAARRLATRGVPLTDIVVFIGPCIHACCYPVGPEVTRAFPPEALKPHADGTALDLPRAIALSLMTAGVPESAVHVAAECTSCETTSFFSHRRDRGVTGRHWALARLAG
jgi:YfiH family protein